MASISINNYNASTGQLYYTTVGKTAPYMFLQCSVDNGVTWASIAQIQYGASPAGAFVFNTTTLLRLVSADGGTVTSNIYAVVLNPTYDVTRTPIENETDISFCNSPIHLRIQNDLQDASIQSAFVYLWIWTGDQDKTLNNPTQVLYAEKVSNSDNYINFEISEYIKAYLISPDLAPNTNQPQFAYNELSPATITGQGIFWQIVADVTSTGGTLRKNYRTSFCTLGYRYDFEQTGSTPYSSVLPSLPKYYNPRIHNYFEQVFNFGTTVATATTANLISVLDLAPNDNLREALDPFLVVYLAKDGLFRCFTPNGKATFKNKTKREEINLSFRNPSAIDNSYVHSKLSDNIDVSQTIMINTGDLEAEMVEEVRQIVLSPKVYLIDFVGDTQDTSTSGITIDNTFVTIDNTNITIDSQTIADNYLGFYKTHRQIPVRLTDTDFEIKTRLNDKTKIDYNLEFEVTTNLINNLR